MADDFYSVTIPGGHCFMIKGVTNAGAGQRFDAHIPGHTQIGIAPMPVPARTQTVTGGGYPNNKPMNPPIIEDSTISALPISIEFFKHYGGSDWRRNTRWRVLSTGSDVRIIGQEDGADNDYNDTVVTISWTPCAGLVGNDAKQIDAAEGLKNITVRIDEIEERLRNVEATAGAAFSLSANSEPDMSADT